MFTAPPTPYCSRVERPTIERVRLKLGRGSPNTITGFLNTWFAQLGPRLAGRGATDVPEPVIAAARELWRCAQDAARAQAQTDHAEHEAELVREREALAARARELEASAARLAAREADLEVAVTALREQLTATGEQMRLLAEQRDAAEAQCAQAQAAVQEAKEQVRGMHEARVQEQAAHAAQLARTLDRHAAQERR
ncbi:DNA-binding protein [Bordetella genomosp. 9]|uniref:KfrA N-terminal DNA-binding domain-containing protein n=1 Tax=Bordetella genomosp. 9 TaxID=1416803 RepID=A0A1W6YZY4_9BORD|nr:hypothetical protein CAL13_10845 [Bordetella genomosp. 9]